MRRYMLSQLETKSLLCAMWICCVSTAAVNAHVPVPIEVSENQPTCLIDRIYVSSPSSLYQAEPAPGHTFEEPKRVVEELIGRLTKLKDQKYPEFEEQNKKCLSSPGVKDMLLATVAVAALPSCLPSELYGPKRDTSRCGYWSFVEVQVCSQGGCEHKKSFSELIPFDRSDFSPGSRADIYASNIIAVFNEVIFAIQSRQAKR